MALIYDLEEQAYRSGEWDDAQADYLPNPYLPVREVKLPVGLRFRDVETSLDGMVTDGRALTRFLPQGYSTPTWIHLEDTHGNPYTVVVHPLLGRAEIFSEHIEAE